MCGTSEPDTDQAFVARALRRLTDDVAALRDDVIVMAAAIRRMGGTQDRIEDGMRAVHGRYDRLADRVRVLEDGGA